MRGASIGKWSGGLFRFASIRWLALATWLAVAPAGIFAADATDSASLSVAATAVKSIPQDLRKILDGTPPRGIAELRAMQGHVQTLAEQLKKCTVGVQVGPAWGSGVIISKDGYVLTAAHVAEAGRNRGPLDVQGADRRGIATFTLADGREVKGKPLGLFRTLDAGLMKITDAGDYPFASWAIRAVSKSISGALRWGTPAATKASAGSCFVWGACSTSAKTPSRPTARSWAVIPADPCSIWTVA